MKLNHRGYICFPETKKERSDLPDTAEARIEVAITSGGRLSILLTSYSGRPDGGQLYCSFHMHDADDIERLGRCCIAISEARRLLAD